ncbi:polyprenyl synthetase family protein [Desulfofustis glycolicus]|uniref:Farnesyl-diphosphate synthase n=1 Tax=Desulfofustis glycolicus DSM 9705 TaxID=1121409 RepID=A0A1M5W5V6_9BACT|nr:farnesyl diphosphate synthase [Desulfofustis glycolicus]SHH82857.1 farnesyl-diphosphate synthase [Desulfofustis glycolicus DSM 9705]
MNDKQTAIKNYLAAGKATVEEALDRLMPAAQGPFADHIEAMRYSLFVGGKRIRPILCLAAVETIRDDGTMLQAMLPVACALECIHTYSLIHDDLPAMDNDDLRRGRPTNHKVHGEAAAILAGDGLLTFAFELLTRPDSNLTAARQLRIIELIARAAGPEGMVGGQALDIANENRKYPFSLLQTIHRSKTGALLTCSVQAGAVGAGATPAQETALVDYGAALGLAFQIVDDLLDATATTEQLGKTAGSDEVRGKATYPGYFGIAGTRDQARQAVEWAKTALNPLGERAERLHDLADYILSRSF